MTILSRNQFCCPKMGLVLCVGMIMCLSSVGQGGAGKGAGDQAIISRTYDTLVTGEGYGKHQLRFSQWDPRLGTLVAVRVKTHTTLQYGFTLRNVTDSSSDVYTVTLGREDVLSSGAMATWRDTLAKQMIDSFPLDAGKWQWQDPHLLMNKDHSDSITDRMDAFKGTGTVLFDYSPVTWSNVHSSNNSNYHYNATVRDTAQISLTYYYKAADSLVPSKLTGIEQPAENRLTLYPNPATNFIHIAFDPVPGDWQVDILAADGHLVQRNSYLNVNQAQVNFSGKPAAGAYFVRATDLRASRNYTGVFVIQ